MDIMRKHSEKFLEILLKMRAERGTDYIHTKVTDFKDIPNIEMNQSDILKDLKRNNCVNIYCKWDTSFIGESSKICGLC